ncbi:ATP synthase F1 subunit gamma [Candidatus Saccharibacteria bacterium]|nr:ATP synthase F1 subunit gamma [Candidatus Saccharibacteria bacterium]
MAQTRTLQRRIRSVKNAKQITKALEVVAASRMRRVVQLVEGSRTYGELAAAIMAKVAANPEAKNLPYFSPASGKPTLYIVFTSDRGQAGAFNANIFHLAINSFKQESQASQVIVFGRKGTRYFSRFKGIELKGAYEDIADVPDINVFASTMESVTDSLAGGEVGKVVLIFTQFISSLTQKATAMQLFPVDLSQFQPDETSNIVSEFEPDITDVIDEGIKLYLQARLMQAKIESAASEHAMRMVAMGNANRNASDLIDNLTLELNATRQAAITQEIAEITGGVAAIAA